MFRKLRAGALGVLTEGRLPGQQALGCALGLALGLVPDWPLQVWLLLAVTLLLRVNLAWAAGGAALGAAGGWLLDPWIEGAGGWLLEDARPLRGLWRLLSGSDLAALTRFDNTAVLGGTLLGLALLGAVPAAWAGWARTRSGRPAAPEAPGADGPWLREAGLLLACLLALAVGGGAFLGRNRLVTQRVESGLERLVGAPARLSGARLDVVTFQVSAEGLALADPRRPGRYLAQAGPVRLRLDGWALLAGRLVVREAELENVTIGAERPQAAAEPPPDPPQRLRLLDREAAPADLSGLVGPLDVPTLLSGRPLGALAVIQEGKRRVLERVRFWLQRLADTSLAQDLRDAEREFKTLRLEPKNPNDLRVLLTDLKVLRKRLDLSQRELAELLTGWRKDRTVVAEAWQGLDARLEQDVSAARAAAHVGGLEPRDVAAALVAWPAARAFEAGGDLLLMARHALRADRWQAPSPRRREGRFVAVAEPGRARPRFVLERGRFSGAVRVSGPDAPLPYEGRLLDWSSDGAGWGRSVRLTAEGTAAGGGGWTLAVDFDPAAAGMPGRLALAARDVPGGELGLAPRPDGLFPERAALGRLTARLEVSLDGDAVAGRLTAAAQPVTFQFAAPPRGNPRHDQAAARLKTRFAGLPAVEGTARLSGTLALPDLEVASSADRAVSDQLKALLGQRLAEAERRIRSAVTAQVRAARGEAEQAYRKEFALLEQTLKRMQERSLRLQGRLEQGRRQAEAELRKYSPPRPRRP
jgi:uncharacterized protein (TIGR03545 family)/uncharacterized protein (TIGR03546 family)